MTPEEGYTGGTQLECEYKTALKRNQGKLGKDDVKISDSRGILLTGSPLTRQGL